MPGHPDRAFVLATVSALLFFVSIVLHELGHALVARRNGIEVADINLWMFGGVASMKGEMPSAGVEFRVAAAGPAVTVLIAAACYGLGVAISGSTEFRDALTLKTGAQPSSAAVLLGWLVNINLFVLVINLIPAFPLDGGRILRAIAWWRTGDRNKATRFAAGLGRGFGWLAVAIGVAWVITGNLWGLWLALIGFMLARWAQTENVHATIASRLEGLRVSDVMDSEPVAIRSGITLESAYNDYFLRYGWAWFPVVDENGRVLGVLTKAQLEETPEEERPGRTVDDAMVADSGFKVRQDAPLDSLLSAEALAQLGGLLAVDGDGVLRGIVTADQVRRALRPA
jgi:Zn-dependent protease/CBS domain-containing protein